MQYKGIYLIDMTPEKWDSLPLDRTRDMLVWKYEDEPILQKRRVIEWFKNKNGAVIWRDENNELWNFCAEIPIETKEDAMKLLKVNEKENLELKEENEKLKTKVNELKNSCSFQYYITMCNVKAKLKDKIENLEKENQELKEKIKSLQVERSEMARDVAWAVDKELIEKAVLDHPHSGHRITIIHELVEKKILEYTENNKPKKKFRKMTYKELSEWLATGKGQYKDGNFGSFRTELVYCKNEENTIVDNDCLIRGFNETEWHEPLIEE